MITDVIVGFEEADLLGIGIGFKDFKLVTSTMSKCCPENAVHGNTVDPNNPCSYDTMLTLVY